MNFAGDTELVADGLMIVESPELPYTGATEYAIDGFAAPDGCPLDAGWTGAAGLDEAWTGAAGLLEALADGTREDAAGAEGEAAGEELGTTETFCVAVIVTV